MKVCSLLLVTALLGGCSFKVQSAGPISTLESDLAVTSPSPDDLGEAQTSDDLATVPSPGADLAMPPPPLDMAVTPILTGAHSDIPATVDLTSEGALDWLHAGLSSASDVNREANVTQLLTLMTSGVGGQYGSYTPKYTWSNGTPTASANTNGGIYANGQNNGFTLTLPTAATTRTVNVYVTGFNVKGKLTAHLSDSAVADYTDTQSIGNANVFYRYTITVRDAAPSTSLTITWTSAMPGPGYSSVDFMAAAVR